MKLKFESAISKLILAENTVKYTNPSTILSKGYSITLFNKKPIKDTSEIKNTDIIETRLFKGKIESEIIRIKS